MGKPDTEVRQVASSVENILNSLSQLEKDIDAVSKSIEDIKKRFSIYADEEIENLKAEITKLANEEAMAYSRSGEKGCR